ncbi:MAG: hypothetical protein IKS83_00385 [Victivallales bacterium]|nr:hypothetical protein [Victivallales bacterium]
MSWKRRFGYVVAAIAIVAIAVLCYRGLCERMALQASDVNIPVLPGDVMLFDSCTPRGLVVRLTNSRSEYAHIVLVCQGGKNPLLIHADPKLGCVAETLSEYLSNNKVLEIAVLRPAVSNEQLQEVVGYAQKTVKERLPFKNSFRYDEGKGLYCTELVLKAYNQAGIKLLPNICQGDIVRPERLLESEFLTNVARIKSSMH